MLMLRVRPFHLTTHPILLLQLHIKHHRGSRMLPMTKSSKLQRFRLKQNQNIQSYFVLHRLSVIVFHIIAAVITSYLYFLFEVTRLELAIKMLVLAKLDA
uniref:Putative ovule protein n=1 Tax=Solanum chacoense TaxID=4108 RepID=A0A0V0HXK4_SOLCH